MVKVYKRIHSVLAKRVRNSKKESDLLKGLDRAKKRKYSDAAKDLYAYVRLMELCQTLSQDVNDLKTALDVLSNSNYEKPN